MDYIQCGYCGKKIKIGEELYQVSGTVGTFCSYRCLCHGLLAGINVYTLTKENIDKFKMKNYSIGEIGI